MFYILPYQNDPEANQTAQGSGIDNPIEGSSTTQQVAKAIPDTLSFVIKPIQVQQNNVDLYKGNETTKEVVKVPEEIVGATNSPSTSTSLSTSTSPCTSTLPAKEPIVKENEIDKTGCRCGMCWETFRTRDKLEVHKCSNATNRCRCTMCLEAKNVRSYSQKKYKRCSMCSTYYKCVHYLKKHVDKYHGSCICGVCKTKFRTRKQCCKHLCPGPGNGSKISSKKPSKTSSKKSSKTSSKKSSKKPSKTSSKKSSKRSSKKSTKKKYLRKSLDNDSDSDSNTVSDSDFDSYSDLDSYSDSKSDSDANDEQSEDIEIDKTNNKQTNTVTNEVLQENDIEIEYIIESERPDIPAITITSIQRKEDYLKVSENLDKSSQITSETPMLIDIQNSDFLADEMNIKKGLVEDNTKHQKDKQNLNKKFVQIKSQEIEMVAIEGSGNENNLKSGSIVERKLLNMKNDGIQQDMKEKTATAMAVSVDIETVESDMVTNEGIERNPCGTDLAIRKGTDDVAMKSNNLMTYSDTKTEIDSVMIPDSDDESITSEAELYSNEGNQSPNEILDTEISESTDDSNDDEMYCKRKINSNKSRSNVAKSKSKQKKVIQCSICSQVFYDKWILNYHIEEEHGPGTDDTDKAKLIQPNTTKESYLDFANF